MTILKDKISQYKKSANARNLLANFISLSALQVISYFFPLITMPYLARVIGVNGFGSIAFASAVIAYFSTVTDWGFRYTAVREISIHRHNISKVSEIFSQVLLCKTILMLCSAVVLYLLILVIPLFRNNSAILWATFALIPGYILFPDWLFQAMEEMKYITVMNIAAKTIFTVLIFCAIKTEGDYVIEPLLQASGYLVSGVIAFWYAIRHFKIKFTFPTIRSAFVTMKGSSNMFVAQFFPTLYNNLSIILLEGISGARANGLFSAGFKFISIMDQVSQALSRTFYPFLARRMDKHNFYVRLSGGISILMSLFLLTFSHVLINIFYTPDFEGAKTVIQIMACSPFFLFLMNSFGTNGLVLIGKDYVLRNIVIICSIIGLILAIVSIYLWNYVGVALAITTTWGIRGFMTYIMYKKYNLQYRKQNM